MTAAASMIGTGFHRNMRLVRWLLREEGEEGEEGEEVVEVEQAEGREETNHEDLIASFAMKCLFRMASGQAGTALRGVPASTAGGGNAEGLPVSPASVEEATRIKAWGVG